MNVDEIISELRKHNLIDNLPPKHHVSRREDEYRNRIMEREVYIPSANEERVFETQSRRIPNIGDYISIPEGDISKFPEIDVEGIRKRVLKEGTDILAWYRSFHWSPQNLWGIYMLDKGIYYIAQIVFKKLKQISDNGRPFNILDLLQQSFKLLFFHEFFHFITDIAASTLEIGVRKPYYIDYVRNVYMQPHGINEPPEEAMSNAFAYNRFQGRDVRYERSIQEKISLQVDVN